MNSTVRKTITFFENDMSITFIKPFSEEHQNMFYAITENAYGNIEGNLMKISDIKTTFKLEQEDYDELLHQLK